MPLSSEKEREIRERERDLGEEMGVAFHEFGGEDGRGPDEVLGALFPGGAPGVVFLERGHDAAVGLCAVVYLRPTRREARCLFFVLQLESHSRTWRVSL